MQSPQDSIIIPAARSIYCNRTLNLRTIDAIGYDMDYTLVHYHSETWEEQAYRRIKELLTEEGWPVTGLELDPELVIRGLIIDTDLGNIVKANRFGYVMRAFHGTGPLPFMAQREAYRHTPVDLSDDRFVFLNTLFSLSEGCLYAQLVDLLDQGNLPPGLGYRELYHQLQQRIERAHLEGVLKDQIVADPERFVDLDGDAALALLDQQQAGKRLMLITNSEWSYTKAIMSYAFDRFLGGPWRELFELIIVAAGKPFFFSGNQQMFAIVEDSGLLRPIATGIPGPGTYHGGDAAKVERYLELSGSRILYVGDHVFADVRMSKSYLRWRTALILRELEHELTALEQFRSEEQRLVGLMAEKEQLERRYCAHRLQLQRLRGTYGPQPEANQRSLMETMAALRATIEELDGRIALLARRATMIVSSSWGPLLRAGNDKSHLARQVERSADIYTSRVSNFLHATPYAYLRSERGSMPHDPTVAITPG